MSVEKVLPRATGEGQAYVYMQQPQRCDWFIDVPGVCRIEPPPDALYITTDEARHGMRVAAARLAIQLQEVE